MFKKFERKYPDKNTLVFLPRVETSLFTYNARFWFYRRTERRFITTLINRNI